jgi:hypothetical protein
MNNELNRHQDKSRMGDKPELGKKGADQGMVGQDTDSDGKAVKPGQKPGQSHGQGLPGQK